MLYHPEFQFRTICKSREIKDNVCYHLSEDKAGTQVNRGDKRIVRCRTGKINCNTQQECLHTHVKVVNECRVLVC